MGISVEDFNQMKIGSLIDVKQVGKRWSTDQGEWIPCVKKTDYTIAIIGNKYLYYDINEADMNGYEFVMRRHKEEIEQ